MRLLVDENVPIASVLALRSAGHDVYSASERDTGTADDVLLGRAQAEDRLLVTFESGLRRPRSASPAVRHRRHHPPSVHAKKR